MVTGRLRHLQELAPDAPAKIELETPGNSSAHDIRIATAGTYRVRGRVLVGGVPTDTELVLEIRRNGASLARSTLVLTGRGGGVCVDLPARLGDADQLSLWATSTTDGMVVPAQASEHEITQTALAVTPTDDTETPGS